MRLALDFTQKRAAEAAGLSANHVSFIESGRASNTSLASLVGLAIAYRVTLVALFQPADRRTKARKAKRLPRRRTKR